MVMRRSQISCGRFLATAAFVSAGAMVLAACGSSGTPSTTTGRSTTTTTQAKTVAVCSSALLGYTPVFGGAAAGGSYYRINVVNSSPNSCALDGYPALTFFAPNAAGGAGSGTPVTITVAHAGASPERVLLSHNRPAQFLLVFTEVPVNGAGCTSIASVDVSVASASGSTPVPVSFAPCGGVVKVTAFAPPGSQNP